MRPTAPSVTVSRRLTFRPPFHAESVFAHLVATAVPGVEEWADGRYRRTLSLPGGPAVIALRAGPKSVECRLRLTDGADTEAAVAIARQLLDLDATSTVIDTHLACDPALARFVAEQPGRRIPGAPDVAELAVRAVIGQQVSTAAGRTHAARLVRAVGTPLPWPDGSLTHTFPAASMLADVPDSVLAMPARRRATLRAVAGALAESSVEARTALASIPGVGPWTLGVVAMRALGDADVFLATDLGVLTAARALGLGPGRVLRDRAEMWRPWRSYATQYLWGALDHPINRLPGGGRRPSPS